MRNETPTQRNETMKKATNNEPWVVEYSEHDCGSQGGYFVRKTEARAKRSAELMKSCGYKTTSYRRFT